MRFYMSSMIDKSRRGDVRPSVYVQYIGFIDIIPFELYYYFTWRYYFLHFTGGKAEAVRVSPK